MTLRPVWAEVDLAAIRHNVGVLARLAGPARVCAVVKAGGYGHGPVESARAALDGGASWLAVALVEEGAQLRDAGIDAPVLLLSEPPAAAMADVVGLGLTATLYTEAGVAAAAAASTSGTPLPVHVKVDTGMHRVGATAADAVKLALTVEERPELALEGLWTHFAVADAPDDPFTGVQHRRFNAVLDELAGLGVRPALAHACNSAGVLAHPDAHHDLVRCGLAVYGVAPSPALEVRAADLRPALALKARVSLVKEDRAGRGRVLRPPLPGRPTHRDRHRPHRLRRRRSLATHRCGRRGPRRRPAAADRGRRHHGPAHGRLRPEGGESTVGGGG